MKRALGLAVLCLFLWPAGEGRASEPTGLYVLVKKVEFGPKGAEKAEWRRLSADAREALPSPDDLGDG